MEDTNNDKILERSDMIPRDVIRSDYDGVTEHEFGPKCSSDTKINKKKAEIKYGVTLDEELVKVKGSNTFLIIMSSLMVSFATAELIIFALPFLELVPPLECFKDGKWISWTNEEACVKGVQYRQINDDKYSLTNWVNALDLTCSSDFETGILGSAWFAGMFIGALFLSPISDIYGRRPVHIIGITLSLIGSLWLYFQPTWFSVIVSLLMKGIGMYSRLSITYLYILEMFDENSWKFVAMIIMAINNTLSSTMSMYFIFGGRNANDFLLGSILILFYWLIFVPLVPESPKLLHSLKKYDETRKVISSIAHINGVKYKGAMFEDEALEHFEIKE